MYPNEEATPCNMLVILFPTRRFPWIVPVALVARGHATDALSKGRCRKILLPSPCHPLGVSADVCIVDLDYGVSGGDYCGHFWVAFYLLVFGFARANQRVGPGVDAPRSHRGKGIMAAKKQMVKESRQTQSIIQSKYNVRRHDKFMTSLQKCPLVTVACKAAGINRSTAYRWRREIPGFATEWDDIVNGRFEELENETFDRALHGVEEPVFWQGKQIATVRKPSDSMAQFLLKAHNPNKYGNKNVTLEGVGKFTMNINDQNKDIVTGED